MSKKTTLIAVFILFGLVTAFSQVGIGTTAPKTTLQVEGKPTIASTADGVQAPALTIAQLDAKIAAYGADQNGAIVYINNVSAGSTTSKSAKITATGYYFYDAPNNIWKSMGGNNSSSTTTYTVGLNADLGGYVFYVTPDGKHGLVVATKDQSLSSNWFFAQNNISNPANHDENGKKFTDWRMPTRYELNLIYVSRIEIGGFTTNVYWSSTEFNINDASIQYFINGTQSSVTKGSAINVRAVRAF